MRPHNSVGGYRIYPTSPENAEACDNAIAVMGQFNEGMDRLHRERQLSEREQHLVDHLDPRSRLAISYRNLQAISARIWQHALEKQQVLARFEASGQFTTEQLGEILNQYANKWQAFKRQLDEQA